VLFKLVHSNFNAIIAEDMLALSSSLQIFAYLFLIQIDNILDVP